LAALRSVRRRRTQTGIRALKNDTGCLKFQERERVCVCVCRSIVQTWDGRHIAEQRIDEARADARTHVAHSDSETCDTITRTAPVTSSRTTPLPDGAPFAFGSVEKERCVFAMQIGRFEKPGEHQHRRSSQRSTTVTNMCVPWRVKSSIFFSAAGRYSTLAAP
jgi:hypothetical protein